MDPESEPSSRRSKKLLFQFLIITTLITGITLHLTTIHLQRQLKSEKPKGYITANFHITPIETLIHQTTQLFQNISYPNNEVLKQDPNGTKPDLLFQMQNINIYNLFTIKARLDEIIIPLATEHQQRVKDLFYDAPNKDQLIEAFEEIIKIERLLIFVRNSECKILPDPRTGPFLHQTDYDQLNRDYKVLVETGLEVQNKLDMMIEYQQQLRAFILRLASEVNYVYNVINSAVQNQTLHPRTLDTNDDNNLKKKMESFKLLKLNNIYKQKIFYILHNNMFLIRIPIF